MLDPHSNFFDPKEYRALHEEQQGHYYGVGMSVQQHNGKHRDRRAVRRFARATRPAFGPATSCSK